MTWSNGTESAATKIVTIGRSPDNDLMLDYPMVSFHHARLTLDGAYAILEDLGSTNGTYVGKPNNRITRLPLSESDNVYFGLLRLPARRLFAAASGKLRSARTSVPIGEKPILLGRDPKCDQVLDYPMVSWRHARISRKDQGFLVEDLDSSNGTFVNGKRIKGTVTVKPGDVVVLGSYSLTLTSSGSFEQRDYHDDVTIEARGVSVNVPGKKLLDRVSLTIYPSEFVGLMGPSGAGKSTLMNALNGYVCPSEGAVFLSGQNLYENYDQFRNQIGYVPQDDIMHCDLKVGQALYYTARLRLPRDFSDRAIHERIGGVLNQLGLQTTEDVLIGSPERKGISGGQRKRVNLAMELLTDPSVLFLDEPTSGLSSEDALMVMNLLRGLADEGKTILLTIHQPSLDIDARSVVEIKHALAIAHVAAGKFSKSITLFEEVAKAAESNTAMKAECLRYLGYLQSDPEKLKQAIMLEEEIGNSQRQSRTLTLLGMYQLESSDIDKAVETLSLAKELFKLTSQLPMLAELPHVGYAIALARNDDPGGGGGSEGAHTLMLPVIGTGSHLWLGESHLWVSAGREDLGDFVLQAVLTHSRSRLTEAHAVRDLGNRYASEGKYDRGDNLFTESYKMLDSQGQYKEAVWKLIFQARRRCEFGNYAAAEAKYREAIAYHTEKPFDDPWTDWFTKQEFADVLWHLGREAEAKKLYGEVAERLAESLRNGVRLWAISDIGVYMNCANRTFPDAIPGDLKKMYERVFESVDFKKKDPAFQRYWMSQRAYWSGDLESAVKHWLATKEWFSFQQWYDFRANELAQRLLGEGREGDAVKVLEHLVAVRDKHLAKHHPSRAICRILLAKTILDAGQDPSQAKSMLEEAKRVLEPHQLTSPQTLKEIDTLLSRVANEKNR